MGSHQPIRKVVTPEIPDKLYFRIGDVARLCEVPAYVLRFWETEFPQLKPNKGGSGQRLYRKRDVEMALRIKSLLYDQGYTIPGARQVFKSEAKPKETATSNALEIPATASRTTVDRAEGSSQSSSEADAASRQSRLQTLRDEMRDLLRILSAPAGFNPSAVLAAAKNVATSSGAQQRGKLQAMRPRLVVENANGAGSISATPRPTPLRALSRFGEQGRDEQAELFSLSLPSDAAARDPFSPDFPTE